jgi:hypothetical protein
MNPTNCVGGIAPEYLCVIDSFSSLQRASSSQDGSPGPFVDMDYSGRSGVPELVLPANAMV